MLVLLQPRVLQASKWRPKPGAQTSKSVTGHWKLILHIDLRVWKIRILSAELVLIHLHHRELQYFSLTSRIVRQCQQPVRLLHDLFHSLLPFDISFTHIFDIKSRLTSAILTKFLAPGGDQVKVCLNAHNVLLQGQWQHFLVQPETGNLFEIFTAKQTLKTWELKHSPENKKSKFDTSK